MPFRSYLHFSLTFFWLFAVIGAVAPFLPLYLKHLNYDAETIGIMMALLLVTKIGFPNWILQIADQKCWHRQVMRYSAVIIVTAFYFLSLSDTKWVTALLIFIYGVSMGCLIPQYDSVLIHNLAEDRHQYSKIRLWGSVGFIVTSLLIGYCVESLGIEHYIVLALFVVVANAIGAFSMPSVDHPPHEHNESQPSIKSILMTREILILFIANFLVYMSHGPFYSLFSIYLNDHNYSNQMVGWLWALGVIAEVIVFWLLARWLKFYSAWFLFQLSLFLTAIRWLIVAYFPESLILISLSQCLHAASFGMVHGITVHLIAEKFSPRQLAQGQAFYNMVGFGLGATTGSVASGFLWERVGEQQTFVLASVIAFLGFGVALLHIAIKPKPQIKKPVGN